MLKTLPKFFEQVRQEFNKITWTSKKQALSITAIVFVMVALTSLYFFGLDWILSSIVKFLLNLGR